MRMLSLNIQKLIYSSANDNRGAVRNTQRHGVFHLIKQIIIHASRKRSAILQLHVIVSVAERHSWFPHSHWFHG